MLASNAHSMLLEQIREAKDTRDYSQLKKRKNDTNFGQKEKVSATEEVVRGGLHDLATNGWINVGGLDILPVDDCVLGKNAIDALIVGGASNRGKEKRLEEIWRTIYTSEVLVFLANAMWDACATLRAAEMAKNKKSKLPDKNFLSEDVVHRFLMTQLAYNMMHGKVSVEDGQKSGGGITLEIFMKKVRWEK